MTGYLLWGSLLTLGLTAVFALPAWVVGHRLDSDAGFVAGILLAAVAGLVLILGTIFTGVNVWELKACEHQAERMDLNWDYSVWTPCLVELPDGRWVNVDEIENNHLTGEVTLKDDES